MGKRLFVGNLSYNTAEDRLRDIFAEAGQITEVKMMFDRESGRPRGFAFVEMASDAEAAKAIESFNGRELDGRTLTVNEAQERGGGGGGGRGGGGGQRRW